MFLKKVGSYAPHTPTPLRGFVWRRGNAASAERSALTRIHYHTSGPGGMTPGQLPASKCTSYLLFGARIFPCPCRRRANRNGAGRKTNSRHGGTGDHIW